MTISGATAATYVLTSGDVGKTITVTVTGSKAGYTTTAKTSAATKAVTAPLALTAAPVPTVTGPTVSGEKSTAVPGTWGPAPVALAYQWKRSGVNISGATAATYFLTSGDVGKTITVTVTGSKAGYTTTAKTEYGHENRDRRLGPPGAAVAAPERITSLQSKIPKETVPFPSQTLERARVFAPGACVWLVASSVLVFQPGGLFRFTWMKVVWLLAAVGIGALVHAGGRLPQGIRRALWAAAVVLAISAAFAANPLASFLGRWPRYEGALVIALYIAVFALGAKVLGGAGRSRNWAIFRTALTPAVVIVSFISAFEAAGLRPLGGAADLRPGATLGNATDQGIIGVLAAAVLALPALRGRDWPARIGLAAAALTTVLSGSRAAILGLAAVVLVLVAAAIRTAGRTRAAAAGGAALLVLGVAAVAIPTARERLLSADTVNGRWLLWDECLKLIAEHPWTGVGPNGFVDAITGFHTLEWAVRVGGTFPPDSPHSWLLQAAAVGGLPLLLAAAVLAFLILRSAGDSMRITAPGVDRDNLTGALAAVALRNGLMLLTAFTSPATTPVAAFICGGLVATSRAAVPQVRRSAKAAPAKASPAVRTWKTFPAGAVATGLLVALGWASQCRRRSPNGRWPRV